MLTTFVSGRSLCLSNRLCQGHRFIQRTCKQVRDVMHIAYGVAYPLNQTVLIPCLIWFMQYLDRKR